MSPRVDRSRDFARPWFGTEAFKNRDFFPVQKDVCINLTIIANVKGHIILHLMTWWHENVIWKQKSLTEELILIRAIKSRLGGRSRQSRNILPGDGTGFGAKGTLYQESWAGAVKLMRTRGRAVQIFPALHPCSSWERFLPPPNLRPQHQFFLLRA